MAKKEETDIATKESKFLDPKQADLRAITTADDIAKLFGGQLLGVEDVTSDWGLIDSAELVNVPFTLVHYIDRDSDEYGKFNADGILEKSEYVSVYVLTDAGKKVVFNDGGVGIREFLEAFTIEHRRTGGLRCPWGLRASVYDKVVDGQKIRATTMYFATSKPKNG